MERIAPRSRVREVAYVVVGQGLAAVGALVGAVVLARLLSVEDYGSLALAMTAVLLVQQTSFGPFSSAALRFFNSSLESKESGNFLRALAGVFGRISLAAALGGAVVGGAVMALGASVSPWLIASTVAFAVVSGIGSSLDALQAAVRNRGLVALHQSLAAWGRIAGAVVCIVLVGASVQSAIWGQLFALTVVLLSQRWWHRRCFPAGDATAVGAAEWRRRLTRYAWPFCTWGVFAWAQLASDRWALDVFASTREVGLYAALYQVGFYPAMLMSGLMVGVVAPVFFQRAGDGTDFQRLAGVHRLNLRLAAVALAGSIVAMLVGALVHRSLFAILFEAPYQTVSWLLPGTILGGGLYATGQLVVLGLLSESDTRVLIAPKIGTAMVGMLLNGAGAAWFGVAGVVAAVVITNFLYLVWTMTLAIRRGRVLRSGSGPSGMSQ